MIKMNMYKKFKTTSNKLKVGVGMNWLNQFGITWPQSMLVELDSGPSGKFVPLQLVPLGFSKYCEASLFEMWALRYVEDYPLRKK